MRLELFHITNNWDDALVLKSCLEFYGLTPFIPNELQLRLNPFKIIAFGGIRIYLLEDELALGEEIRATQADYEILDQEPVPKRLKSMKIRTVVASIHWLFPWVAALLAVCPPFLVAIVWITVFPWLYMTIYWWFCAVIICIPLHARYIALPRLNKDTA